MTIIQKYQNIKIFCKKHYPNWSDEVFMIKNVKNTVRGDMLLVTVKTNKLLERFTKKKCKTQIKNNLGQKASKIKDDELHVKSKKKNNNSFGRWIDNQDIVQMSEDFPKPKSLGANMKVELDLYENQISIKQI